MASIDDIVTSLQQGVRAMNALTQALQAAFPQAGADVTHSATAGGDTLPANPTGFLTITVNGTPLKVPLYDP